MKNEFLNYSPQLGLFAASYRNNGFSCGNSREDFIECMIDNDEACMSLECYSLENTLESILDFLDDGEAMANNGITDTSRVEDAYMTVQRFQENR